jgi:hypothetical protein
VRTGCCPHTAIRDDITANLDAVEELVALHDPDLVLVESGGDNLTATFSYGLIDKQIFVVDVAGGDKVPRKGGPGVIRSDLLVITRPTSRRWSAPTSTSCGPTPSGCATTARPCSCRCASSPTPGRSPTGSPRSSVRVGREGSLMRTPHP